MYKEHNDLHSWYSENRANFFHRRQELKRKINYLSWLRLLVFLGAIGMLWLISPFSLTLSIVCFILLMLIFVVIIRLQSRLQDLSGLLQAKQQLMEKELQALNGEWPEFENPDDPAMDTLSFVADLDIFGRGSLYQYINRTFSGKGENRLSYYLCDISTDRNMIHQRQQCIRELSDKHEWIITYYAIGKQNKLSNHKYARLLSWAGSEKKKYWSTGMYLLLSIAIPAIQSIMLILLITGVINGYHFLVSLLAALAINGLFLRRVNRVHNSISKTYDLLLTTSGLIQQIEKTPFSSAMAKQLQSQLHHEGISPAGQLRKLSKIVSALDNRLNILVGIFLNALVMWDLQQMIRLEKWHHRFGHKVPEWISVTAEFEALCSLAVFAINHPGFSFAELSDTPGLLEAVEAGHPLIDKKRRVCNNFIMQQQGQFVVITGANMAGKSTFLRTIGVNIVLAASGTVVCAKKWNYFPVKLLTGIRISDNLLNNESYFYAELKRLQQIVESKKQGEKSMILLDEILRGTNSSDKHRGTVLLLKKLLSLNGAGIIATHDVSIGSLEKELPGKIVNHCFEVELENDELYFDYKLKPGISQKLNASFLLEKMGIVDAATDM